jgi:hypothetical protein
MVIPKLPIDDYACLNLDSPVLPAYEAFVSGSVYWLGWCDHCDVYHRHGPAEGHRETHCNDPASPYWNTGYNLEYAGRLADQ